MERETGIASHQRSNTGRTAGCVSQAKGSASRFSPDSNDVIAPKPFIYCKNVHFYFSGPIVKYGRFKVEEARMKLIILKHTEFWFRTQKAKRKFYIHLKSKCLQQFSGFSLYVKLLRNDMSGAVWQHSSSQMGRPRTEYRPL